MADTNNGNNLDDIRKNMGENILYLSISIITFLILFYFFISYIKNLLIILKNYMNQSILIHNTNKNLQNDNNIYYKDFDINNNNKNEIIKSINDFKKNHKDSLNKLIEYKRQQNNDPKNSGAKKLDTNIYSEINSKILSDKYDNYKYNNKKSLVDFIKEIFSPVY